MTTMKSIAEMTKVALRKDLTPGTSKAVEAGGQKILLVYAGGDYFALDNRCSGCGGELQDARVSVGMLSCARCPSMYYYRHGGVKRAPAAEPLKAYQLRYDSEAIYVGPEKGIKIKEHKVVTKETPIKW